jgi:3',5'-cyclic AMP phosphodiesterase CpdA
VKRGRFLEHLGWTGAGITFTVSNLGAVSAAASAAASDASFSFVQISDSHIGFKLAANDHVAATLQATVDAINALPVRPAFVVHTGDVTHLSKPAQFDDAKSILSGLKAPLFTIPGEHDVIGDAGKAYYAAFAKRGPGDGWYSFDLNGTHFVALVNVFDFETMGLLGTAQLDWLRKDLASLRKDAPLVVFGHVPLYALYPDWGWTTADGAQALALLRPFANVTVLNGHVHQIVTHSDGAIRFATARSTAYPQPEPGKADKPGPLVVPRDHLLGAIGYRSVELAGVAVQVEDRALG